MKNWTLPAFETLGVLWALAWGAWVASPWWTTFSVSTFSTMAAIGPDWIWGGVPMLLAAAVVMAERWGRQWFKRSLYGLLMAFFLFVSVVLTLGNWKSTGGITYAFLAAYYALLSLRWMGGNDD